MIFSVVVRHLSLPSSPAVATQSKLYSVVDPFDMLSFDRGTNLLSYQQLPILLNMKAEREKASPLEEWTFYASRVALEEASTKTSANEEWPLVRTRGSNEEE